MCLWRGNRVSVYRTDKNLWVQRKIYVKDQLDTEIRVQGMRRLRGSSLREEGGVTWHCWGVKKERKWFCLQFWHPGSVEAHGHTGGAGSVTHLPQHATPLLFIILIPNKTKRRVRSRNKHNGNPWKRKYWSHKLRWLTARRQWPLWVSPPCSPSEPWRSHPRHTVSRRCSRGWQSSSPEETLWRAPTWEDTTLGV